MRNRLGDFSPATQWYRPIEECLHIWKNLCSQNSIASQMKEIFWHASFQNIYLLCTWKGSSLSPAKEVLQQNEDENQEGGRNGNQKTVNLTQDVSLQSDHYPKGRLILEWPSSNRKTHSRVTVVQQEDSLQSDRRPTGRLTPEWPSSNRKTHSRVTIVQQEDSL